MGDICFLWKHCYISVTDQRFSSYGGCQSSGGILLKVRDFQYGDYQSSGVLCYRSEISSFGGCQSSFCPSVESINHISSMEAINHQRVFCYRSEISSMEAINHNGIFCYRWEISSVEAISHQGVFYYRLEVSSMEAVNHQGVFYYRSEISSMEARPRKNRVVFQVPCQKKIRVGQHFFVVVFF